MSKQAAEHEDMERSVHSWIPAWAGAVLYPGLLLAFDGALQGYHQSGSSLLGLAATLAMLLAASVPLLAFRALLITREQDGPVLTRGLLLLIFATPSLFSLTNTLARIAGMTKDAFIVTWIATWLAVGLMLYLRHERAESSTHQPPASWLRVVHGVTALCLLLGFLLAHLTNHQLAVWSVQLHDTVLQGLRQWYRSAWIEPVLLTLMIVMIITGVPMVLRYARQRLDPFRVTQVATGAYVGVFICSHVTAVLNGRRLGVETDWFFAAGPASLLDGTSLLGRLIPHYLFGTLCLILHVACGLRIVLLEHGAARVLGNRALYAVASLGLVVTIVIMAALLGFHIEAPG